jgi:hypothetical protein
MTANLAVSIRYVGSYSDGLDLSDLLTPLRHRDPERRLKSINGNHFRGSAALHSLGLITGTRITTGYMRRWPIGSPVAFNIGCRTRGRKRSIQAAADGLRLKMAQEGLPHFRTTMIRTAAEVCRRMISCISFRRAGSGSYLPNLVGNPHPAHPTSQEWFNPDAFAPSLLLRELWS